MREFDAQWDSVCSYCGASIKSPFALSCKACENFPDVQGPQDDPSWRRRVLEQECLNRSAPDTVAAVAFMYAHPSAEDWQEYGEWSKSLPCLHGTPQDVECPECLRVLQTHFAQEP